MAKKTDIYQEQFNTRLQLITDTIINMESNLRCCGNCIYFKHGAQCSLNVEDAEFFRVCNSWECDRLQHQERLIK